jgi:hypothetical protein
MPQIYWSKIPELLAGLRQQSIISSRTNKGRLVAALLGNVRGWFMHANAAQGQHRRFLQSEAVAGGPEAWHT